MKIGSLQVPLRIFRITPHLALIAGLALKVFITITLAIILVTDTSHRVCATLARLTVRVTVEPILGIDLFNIPVLNAISVQYMRRNMRNLLTIC